MQPTTSTVTSMVLTSSTLPQSPAQPEVIPQTHDLDRSQPMDWLFKKERIYLLAQFWQQRATLAEKEISSLKEQLNNNTLPKMNNNNNEDHDLKTSTNTDNSIDNKILHRDTEITRLMEEVQRLQKSLTKIQETSLAQITCLEQQLEHRNGQIACMEARLELQRDYDEIRKELILLKSKQSENLNGDDDDDDNDKVDKPTNQHELNKMSIKSDFDDDDDNDDDADKDEIEESVEQNVDIKKENIDDEGNNEINMLIGPSHGSNIDVFGQEIMARWRQNIEQSMISSRSSDKDNSEEAMDQNATSTLVPGPMSDVTTGVDVQKIPSPLSSNEEISLSLQQQQQAAMCAAFFRNATADETNYNPVGLDVHHSRIGPYRFVEDLGSMVNRLGESLIPKGDPMEARLQEMLRFNMDKYASQNLDTLHISRKVRELLSIHNIGQRLFAKYVLGLSQGTVSELLSKPKPWDKLTEKGRDSYRKMHAWAYDDNAVMLLKSLIPKKGKESSMLPFSGSSSNGTSVKLESDPVSDERISHLLGSESNSHTLLKSSTTTPTSFAQMDEVTPPNNNNNNNGPDDSSSIAPNSGMERCSPLSLLSRRLKKEEHDDISQDKVMRIYQEELSKLMNRKSDDFRLPREHFPGLFFPQFLPMDKHQDDFRLALDAYSRELAKINTVPNFANILAIQQQQHQQAALMLHHHHQQQQQQQQAAAMAASSRSSEVQDLSLPKETTCSRQGSSNKCNGFDDNKDNTSETESSKAPSAFNLSVRPSTLNTATNCSSTASSPLGNAILPPEDFQVSANMVTTTVSPLQKMASITNSLISQPSASTHPSPSQRPLKAVLPPITQQQFDMYNNLNTEEIVKKVKENLSQYSISQRLFGESVLGLSQGSVSDLLARPKPWHMLTQKGREPFIRMKMFLEDENAVHKLVASQYKIAPEKLMRTGGYSGTTLCPPTPTSLSTKTSNQSQSSKLLSETVGLLNKFKQEQINSLHPPMSSMVPCSTTTAFHPNMPPTHPLHFEALKKLSQNTHSSSSVDSMRISGSFGNSLGPSQHLSPSVYEMAALTQDLDTQMITTKIKEALLANNIGQKIFGEAVLGLSQGSVSELLSKPKPWHMLSIKGREPFIRMQLWLNDTNNIERLQALKNERREATKRRRSFGCISNSNQNAPDNSSDTSSNDTSDFYSVNSPGGSCSLTPSSKKQRVLFSDEQKEALKLAFTLDSYPNANTIEYLANELGLSSQTISNWFHNHRMRLKQQAFDSGISRLNEPTPQTTFDPINFRLQLNQRLQDISKDRLNVSNNMLLPSYLQSNPSFALLLSRGLLSTDVDLSLLNNTMKEQMRGLDLTLKRDHDDDYDQFNDDIGEDDDYDDNISRLDHSDESQMSNVSATFKPEEENNKPQPQPQPQLEQQQQRSRRKPVAPQWVNPEWQDSKKVTDEGEPKCITIEDNIPIANETDDELEANR